MLNTGYIPRPMPRYQAGYRRMTQTAPAVVAVPPSLILAEAERIVAERDALNALKRGSRRAECRAQAARRLFPSAA